MSAFQMFILHEYHTCGVLIINFPMFSCIIFSDRYGLKSYLALLHYIIFILLLLKSHTKEIFLKGHKNKTFLHFPLKTG